MSSISFDISGPNAPAISEKIVASTLNAVQQLLPEDKIRQVCTQIGYTWRERVLSPAVAVLHMVLASLWPEESFNASWQVQGSSGDTIEWRSVKPHSPVSLCFLQIGCSSGRCYSKARFLSCFRDESKNRRLEGARSPLRVLSAHKSLNGPPFGTPY